MGDETGIIWADHTFNPWQGCTKVPGSGACDHCYAETLSVRIGKGGRWGPDGERAVTSDGYWRNPETKWRRTADERGRPGLVFCGSMCDVFEDRPDLAPTRARLFDLIDRTPYLRWLLLTKRPENVRRLAAAAGWSIDGDCTAEVWPDHAWIGTTVEDQAHADERIPLLLDIPAPVHFVSAEPLLGRLDLTRWLHGPHCPTVNDHPSCICFRADDPRRARRIDWVIAGGEAGAGFRPLDLDHARALRDQVADSHAAFLFKQVGGITNKAGGDELDGRLHRAWPPQAGRPNEFTWTCGRCLEPIVDEDPHTDPETDEDVHERCCASCNPQLAVEWGIDLDATTDDLPTTDQAARAEAARAAKW